MTVEVSANAPYAAALEFGTSKMAERPYMRPAVARKRKEAIALVRKAVRDVVVGGKRLPGTKGS
jgi:HK97 gp10 family phage protein